MRFKGLRRFLFKPLSENILHRQVTQRFKFRDIMEVVRKREEFKYKLHEAIKKKNNNDEVTKFGYYIETIDWIIQSKNGSK